MKKNANKYKQVIKLPSNALTVKEYADKHNISTSYIYKQIKEKKTAFKIVVFQTINFIIPA
jgi:predicted transcriptional regulator